MATMGRKLAGSASSGGTHGDLFLFIIREELQIIFGGAYYATPIDKERTGIMKTIDVVAAIIEQDGKILLARRPESGDQAGLWEFPGGKVDANESQPAALARELEEELAIKAVVGDYVASHQREVSGRIIHLHAWHVSEFSGELTALCHSELVWCLPAEAFDYPLAPADIPLLKAFIALRDARLKDSC
jgi:(d)CTP diphosphatase